MIKATRQQWAWAFYDWANSAFATTVMAGFFPVFFKQFWASDLDVTQSTFWLGLGNSVASAVVLVASPIIGALADRRDQKKRVLIAFTFLGVLATAGLFVAEAGQWPLALGLYMLGTLGFSGGLVGYDALLVDVAEEREYDRVSALGFSLGYLGGGLLFALNVWMVTQPTMFGLEDAAQAVRLAFLSVAIWWAICSLPIMLMVHQKSAQEVEDTSFAALWRGLFDLVRDLRQHPQAAYFLLAYWLYIDGVDTIVRMAVDYGLAIGFGSSDLLAALLLTQFVGFPSALVFGRIGDKYGPKAGIVIALIVYVLVVFFAWRMTHSHEFYILATAIGLVQGGIQALSRSLFARLIPPGKAGSYFGLYNMLGKFAAVLGPVLVGAVSALSGNPRAGILAVLVLFVAGGLLLQKVKPDVGG